jgi:hypothetical protein
MKEDIIRMAREAGLQVLLSDAVAMAENAYKKGQADEREACAKVCDEQAKLWPDEGGDAGTCAIYIRERRLLT